MTAANSEYAEIRKFGIVLRRLALEHLETVRVWRNDPAVSQWLVFQGQIAPEQQRQWFDKLDQSIHFYYVIEYHSKPIGLVNLKNFDTATATAEGGIFIGEQCFQNGMLAFAALLAMYDFGFDILDLKDIRAFIMRDNCRAIRLNQALGFRKVPNQPPREDRTELWTLQRDFYLTQTAKLREYFNCQ